MAARRRWPAWVAGGAVVLVGATNAVLGALALRDPFLGVTHRGAWGLVAGGVLLALLGGLVARGSQLATAVTLTAVAVVLAVTLLGGLQRPGVAVVPAVLAVLLAIALSSSRTH